MRGKSSDGREARVRQAIAHTLTADIDAYAVIYEVCDGPLRAFIGSRYGHLGRDFANEVAIRTHEYAVTHLDEYDPNKGASVQTWLNWQSLNVAKLAIPDWCDPKTEPFDEKRHNRWAASVPGPAELYEAKRRSQLLNQEYNALDEDGRLSVALHDEQGLSVRETARRTGMPVIRVRRLLEQKHHRLARRLRRLGVRPVETDSTPAPMWTQPDSSDKDDDWTASVTAVLPDGPDTLVGAAAKDLAEEKAEE